ncbi:hypothetical protein HXX76_012945 [Chlamydomonas incerta]|uniref:Peptidase S8/S53 domain-containing protein n=1 Tax=Chlamydomonas incerta TaxID=51695 RepID=A0A835SJD3_CHLIN|nr:hypothetical protein HXX76_012945 [Chlamydomonas incerta]|eukprot:KAG2426631.1 hypothetical protein HXX76_012945 [Chlamydomonas incerta]
MALMGLLLLTVAGAAVAERFILGITPAATQAALDTAVKALGGKVEFFHSDAGIAVVAVPEGGSAAAGLAAVSGVTAVAANMQVQLPRVDASDKSTSPEQASTTAAVSSAAGPSFLEPNLKATNLQYLSQPLTSEPKDMLYPLQWAPRLVRPEGAWAAGVTGKCVRVAVVDTGMWWDHPDLVGRVDVDAARSFIEGEPPYYDNDPVGGYWHASHVAGIVAASANNNDFGVVGIAPEATIIPVKVLNGGNGGDAAGVIMGILYAASPLGPDGAGADIINLSLGTAPFYRSQVKADNAFLGMYTKALNYAAAQGVVVIAAAGNDGVDLDHDPRYGKLVTAPCTLGNTVCVSASGPTDICKGCSYDPQGVTLVTCPLPQPWNLAQQPALYSNYGRSAVWVAGPGGDIRSVLAGGLPPGAPPCYVHDWVLGVGAPTPAGRSRRFFWAAGTSMAAPAVSGAAALVIHDAALRKGVDLCAPRGAGKRNPTNPGQVKTALARGAVLPNGAADREAYGNGIVDVSRTLGYPQPAWAA